jgi:hypothetical protein
LHAGYAVDEQEDIVTVVAVVGVDAELVDDLEVVFAPVLEVDQRVVQGCAIFAGKCVDFPQGLCGGEDIRGDDFIEQSCELGVGQADAVQGLELLAEVLLQRGAVADVPAILVFEVLECANETVFNCFLSDYRGRVGRVIVARGRTQSRLLSEL